ncbi:uridine kinase family protein [Anaerosalibacter sp. Marseille-P3206]|uniref:uridine kinase family protein n=1 Tax=Anaerosalibacter sp. Marseille-P3206 TaxID=1871005 RepID=UPI00190E696A|nr:deoxynucleoside kinase [Anaerosalibacter sp. Marseille-P3206]
MKSSNNILLKQYKLHQKMQFQNFDMLIDLIDTLLLKNQNVNVAIDGNSGSGKTTLSKILEKIYDCNVFHMDDFFLRTEQKTKERLEEVGGNVDYKRFKEEIIDNLYSNHKFQYQIYDCKQMELTEFVTVIPKKLNIIEGVYSMHPTLIDSYNLKIFLTIDKYEQGKRILKRNGPLMYERFINEWIPMENKYFKQMKIREKSDIVL